jgi:hypothetical protein
VPAAELTETLSPGAARARLTAVHGRTYVCSVFAAEWPEEADIGEEVGEDSGDEPDLLDIDIETMTVARALRQGYVVRLSRITALSQGSIEERLRGFDARTRVRTALAEVWPGANKLGYFSAAQVLKCHLIQTVAGVVNLPASTVQERLTAAHGRTYVRSVFTQEWPAEAGFADKQVEMVNEASKENAAPAAPVDIPRSNHDALTRLTQGDEDALVDLLEDCRSVRDVRALEKIVERLPPEIRSRIHTHSSLHIHLTSIVQTCAYYPGGIQALRDSIYRFEGRSRVLTGIDDLLSRIRSRQEQ